MVKGALCIIGEKLRTIMNEGTHASKSSSCVKSIAFTVAASSGVKCALGASLGFDSSRSRDVNGGNFRPPLVDGRGENGGT
jgi:hypothetical protein